MNMQLSSALSPYLMETGSITRDCTAVRILAFLSAVYKQHLLHPIITDLLFLSFILRSEGKY